jgi:predicted DNA-binding mobile mystery protein A
MTTVDLARRMGVARQSVAALEASEIDGKARLSTLRRAAQEMDCTLVYAIIPNSSLQEAVENRAEQLLDAQTLRVAHSMLLEDQSAPLTPAARSAAIDDLIGKGRLWSYPATRSGARPHVSERDDSRK